MMTRHALSHATPRALPFRALPFRALPLAAAFVLCTVTAPAFAQGTPEQQQACTPDAVKLCADTIPDIGKTTACMKAHKAELSPRCRAVFAAATQDKPTPDTSERPHRRRVARAPRLDEDTPDTGSRHDVAPEDAFPDAQPRRFRSPPPDEAADDEDVDRARAIIGRLCDDDQIDPGTCATTERALDEAR